MDEAALGYSYVKDRLINEGYTVKQEYIDSPLFEEADLVVIAYPKKDFSSYEIDRLREQMRQKNGFFLMDPEEPGIYPHLREFLAELGIAIGDDVILDRTSRLYGADDLIPVITNTTQHPIVKDFEAPLFFPLLRSIKMGEQNPPDAWSQDYLLFSSDDSWGETNYSSLEKGNYSFSEEEDVKGPLAVALAMERKEKPHQRVVTIGDSDFINNTNFNAGQNQLLFLNAIQWIFKEPIRDRIQKAQSQQGVWILSESKRTPVFLMIFVFPAVLSFLLFGGFFLIRRLLT